MIALSRCSWDTLTSKVVGVKCLLLLLYFDLVNEFQCTGHSRLGAKQVSF